MTVVSKSPESFHIGHGGEVGAGPGHPVRGSLRTTLVDALHPEMEYPHPPRCSLASTREGKHASYLRDRQATTAGDFHLFGSVDADRGAGTPGKAPEGSGLRPQLLSALGLYPRHFLRVCSE